MNRRVDPLKRFPDVVLLHKEGFEVLDGDGQRVHDHAVSGGRQDYTREEA